VLVACEEKVEVVWNLLQVGVEAGSQAHALQLARTAVPSTTLSHPTYQSFASTQVTIAIWKITLLMF